METIARLEERLRGKEKVYYDTSESTPDRKKLKKEILELEKRIRKEKEKLNKDCEKKGKPKLFNLEEKPPTQDDVDDTDLESTVCTIL